MSCGSASSGHVIMRSHRPILGPACWSSPHQPSLRAARHWAHCPIHHRRRRVPAPPPPPHLATHRSPDSDPSTFALSVPILALARPPLPGLRHSTYIARMLTVHAPEILHRLVIRMSPCVESHRTISSYPDYLPRRIEHRTPSTLDRNTQLCPAFIIPRTV